jgi:hypothetical protein
MRCLRRQGHAEGTSGSVAQDDDIRKNHSPSDSYENAVSGCFHAGGGAGSACMDDFVVDQWNSDVERSSPRDFLWLHAMWTPFGRLMSCKIRPVISVGCYLASIMTSATPCVSGRGQSMHAPEPRGARGLRPHTECPQVADAVIEAK